MKICHRLSMVGILLALLVGLILSGCGAGPATAVSSSSSALVTPEATDCTCAVTGNVVYTYQKAAEFNHPELEEPVGLAFHPGRQSLFRVGKQGQVIEVNLEGQVVQQKHVIQDAELTGLTYDPAADLLYLLQADGAALLQVEPASLAMPHKIDLSGVWPDEPAEVQLEGLTFVSQADQPDGGTFYLAARSGPAKVLVLEVALEGTPPTPRSIRTFTIIVPNLIDMAYDSNTNKLLAISDSSSLLFHFDLTGQMSEALALPSESQAAIALDDQQSLYLSEASNRLVKYQPVEN